jgi:hypothetical protein
MTRSVGWGRAALVAAMALVLAATPLRAGATEGDADPGLEGVGNIVSYSMCAGGIVAGALSGNLNTLLGAMVFCRQLYREAA